MTVWRREFVGSLKHTIKGTTSYTTVTQLSSEEGNPKEAYTKFPNYMTYEEQLLYFRQAVLKFLATLHHTQIIQVIERRKSDTIIVYYRELSNETSNSNTRGNVTTSCLDVL